MATVEDSGLLETSLDYLIEFRDPINYQIVLSNKFYENCSFDFFSGNDPLFREFHFSLPPGSYVGSVDIFDRKSGRSFLTPFTYECRDIEKGVWISDIVLLQEREGAIDPQPLVGNIVGGIADRIQFRSHIYGQRDELLTIRANLYRQQRPHPVQNNRELLKVNQYTTAVQPNKIIELKDGIAQFSCATDLSKLKQGTYLLKIFLYRHDSLIAEKNTSFVLPWKRLKEVFLDLEMSISQMAHIASFAFIDALINVKEEEIQIAKFIEFWQERADPDLEEVLDPLERYYSRIFYANDLFLEPNQEGWKTNRGRVLTLYGFPNNRFNRQWNGNIYKVWSYHDRGLEFLFRFESGRWKLIYPINKN